MRSLAWLLAALLSSVAHAQEPRPPIIDMHMHAWSLEEFGGQSVPGCIGAKGVEMLGIDPAKPFDISAQAECKLVVQSPATDEQVLAETLAEMKRLNIVTGVIAGDGALVARWQKVAPDRFIPAASFFIGGVGAE